MERLSLKRYAWKCVLGAEVLYVACILGGLVLIRSPRGMELHHSLFETLPGFTWINLSSVILGAVYILVFAWFFGWYFVWMHNSSLEIKK